MGASIFTAEETAEAPADNDNRTPMSKTLDPLLEGIKRVVSGAEVPALLPPVDPETCPRQFTTKREGSMVAAQEPRDDQHRPPVQRSAGAALAKSAEHPAEIPHD